MIIGCIYMEYTLVMSVIENAKVYIINSNN